MAQEMQLDKHICFQLYTGSRLMQRMYRPYLEEWGITYVQYLVLVCLWEQDGQSIGELSTPLDLDSGTLSPLLKRMETAGLVTREHNPKDYRKVHFFLTSKSTAMEAEAKQMYAQVAASLGLDDADLHALHAIMAKINPSADAI
ncbi:MarR family transcriptional regulator [Corynebacterium sp. sy017]|uniref:MarR family winged helix-turn-helix transcriptional regulator n=1 Tax=unclassified Corynebacterium TaxID=2624378 RepID=UPI001185C6CF|nr:MULTISPECIES: MarR family transcriptional regulator [unclassified Corynebacterium]MBP3088327.1 MarR family transcriptional regulator [Corynebacterium sp. sy017]QDZ41780.1 MarR family transcriptional regulator [Corynebacterium sp. sy039]TSD91648.1 MarR family transcriptional regulator [Corynebacterium sp. SY003]